MCVGWGEGMVVVWCGDVCVCGGVGEYNDVCICLSVMSVYKLFMDL